MADRTFYPARSLDNDMIDLVFSFTTNGASAPTAFTSKHVSGIVRNGAGDLTVTLTGTYITLWPIGVTVLHATPADYTAMVQAVTTNTVRINLRTAGAAADSTGAVVYVQLKAKNSSV
jgi:hypothetical protein